MRWLLLPTSLVEKWLRDMRVRVAKAIIVSVAVRLSVWPNVKASSQSATLAASRMDVC